MSFRYNDILNIPMRSLINKRITKAFFLKNFGLTAVEKKLLNKSIDSMEWMASIKPSNANIVKVKNDGYNYEEVQIMICTLRNGLLTANLDKCIVLFQKHIPYHILLIVEDENEFVINTCDKRINKADNSKRTIEQYFSTNTLSKLYKNEVITAFFNSLNFTNIDKTNMETTYVSYIKAIIQYKAASIVGKYVKRTKERSQEDMDNLIAIEKLEQEISNLAIQIRKESQLNNQVELNIVLQGKRQQILDIKDKLSNE